MFWSRDRHPAPRRAPQPPRIGLLAKLGIGTAALVGGTALLSEEIARTGRQCHPPRGRFVDLSGTRLNYIERGTGTCVIVLHGNGTLLEDTMVSGLFDALAARYRTVALSRPGFGYSTRARDRTWTADAQARAVIDLMNVLGIERTVVVGHSWGCLVALALALSYPGRIEGLVLAGGYYYPTPRSDVPLFTPQSLPVLGDILRYTVLPIVGAGALPFMAASLFWPQPVPQRFIDDFPAGLVVQPSHLRAAGEDSRIMVSEAARLSTRYEELALPMAVVFGEKDQISTPKRQSERFAHETGALSIPIPEEGHMIHYGHHDRIAAAVTEIMIPNQTARRNGRSLHRQTHAAGNA